MCLPLSLSSPQASLDHLPSWDLSLSFLAVSAALQMFWMWIVVLQEIQALVSLSLLPPICLNAVLEFYLMCVCAVCPLPGLRGGEEVVWPMYV